MCSEHADKLNFTYAISGCLDYVTCSTQRSRRSKKADELCQLSCDCAMQFIGNRGLHLGLSTVHTAIAVVIYVVFTVRRSALHGLSYRNSVCLSVRPSVCLSVTLVDCVHTVRPMIMISSPYGSPIILVSGDIKLIPKFEGRHPERGR